MDGKEVCFFTPNPFPILAIHSHLQHYMLRTVNRKENIVAHKMLVVFFSRKVLDAGKLLLLEDLEYQVEFAYKTKIYIM